MRTQQHRDVLKQASRRLHIVVKLLNKEEIVIESLEGITIDGSVNMDSESTYRRSGSVTMVLEEKYNLLPSPDSKVWLNNRCSISIGIDHYSGTRVWFDIGRFAINNVDISINENSKTIALQLSDYMAFLDGTLGGELSHAIKIPKEDSTVSEAIQETVLKFGQNLSIEDIGINGSSELVPYNIEKPSGSSAYELIKELIDLYKGYDFYYDSKGYLIVEKIKDHAKDPIIATFDDRESNHSISLGAAADFAHVRNSVFIWGQQFDDGRKIKQFYRNKYSRSNIVFMNQITNQEEGDLCYVEHVDKSFRWDGTFWNLMDFNVIPMFNIENIGEKIITLNEGNIFTLAQARLQAEYLLENRSSLDETITISTVPMYNLNIHDKIYVNSEGIEGNYLITNISVPFDISSTMSISASKLYK